MLKNLELQFLVWNFGYITTISSVKLEAENASFFYGIIYNLFSLFVVMKFGGVKDDGLLYFVGVR